MSTRLACSAAPLSCASCKKRLEMGTTAEAAVARDDEDTGDDGQERSAACATSDEHAGGGGAMGEAARWASGCE